MTDYDIQMARVRPLIQMKDAEGNRAFREFLGVLSNPLQNFEDVSLEVLSAFDVDTAEGDQLDKIGSILDLPRSGFSDDRYRTFIKIQIDIYQSIWAERDGVSGQNWTGTHNGLLRIIRLFIGPTPGENIKISTTPPYSFFLELPPSVLPLPLDEYYLLFRFIRQAIYAAVLGLVEVAFDATVWASAAGAVVNPGVWGSAAGVVLGASLWAGVITTDWGEGED